MRPPSRSWLSLPAVLCLLASCLVPAAVPSGHAAAATLTVRSVSPAPGTTEVATATTILVAFDRPVVALTGIGQAQPPSPLVSNPPLTGSGHWLTSAIYEWQTGDLRGATIYDLKIPAGLRAIDGTQLQQTFAWRFATIRPAVQSVAPTDTYAVPRPVVSATFNQPMDRAATQAAFSLRDAAGHSVPGVFSWRGPTLQFQPDQPLVRTESYVASLSTGARAAEGPLPMVAPVSWNFSVAPYLQIVGASPPAGSSAADLSSGITITFNAPVDEASAIESVRLIPDVPGRYITFGDNDLSLQIYGNFSPSTAYTVQVKAGLRARAGDTLAIPFGDRFVSAPLPPQLFFVTGSAASYDAYRPIILSLQAVNPGPINFGVYRLDTSAFLSVLGNPYGPDNGNVPLGPPLLQFTRTVDTPLNQPTPVQVSLTLPNGRPLPPGYYFVRASGEGNASDRQVLVVTRTNLTMKVDQQHVLVWATDLASGKPVAGVHVRVMTINTLFVLPGGPLRPGTPSNGVVVPGGTTGSDGTAELTAQSLPANQPLASMGLLALGSDDTDVSAVSSNWSNGISPYNYGLSSGFSPDRVITLLTDRPIYRPAQIVHLRGIVRADNDGQYSLVGGAVNVVITNPQGQVTARRTLALDAYGAFHLDFTLPAGASLGNYSISATSGDTTQYTSIQVAEYRNPTFSVSVTATHPTYTVGQKVQATVNVNYYFGGGVPRAKVHWSLLGYDYIFYSDLFPDYTFGSYDPGAQTTAAIAYPGPMIPVQGGYTLFQGNATTDAHGVLRLSLPAKLPKDRMVQGYTLEANVTDLDNQPVAGNTSLTVFSSAFQIGLSSAQQVVDPGKPVPIDIVTVQNNGTTPAAHQTVHMAIYRRTWKNVVIHNKDGSVTQSTVPVDAFLRAETVQTDRYGHAAFLFTAPTGGEYHLVARAQDQYRNRVQSTLEIYAGGPKPVNWGFQQQGHIRLIADKRTYHTGDIAHVLVATPLPGMTALISLERGNILSYYVTTLAGTSTTLNIPIPATYLPDTYLSVVVEHGAMATGAAPVWRLGYVRLHVDPNERALHLTVTPARTRIAPGGSLTLHLHATDASGKPVQAQTALSVVDAATLALSGDDGSEANLLSQFYGLLPLGVVTADTLNVSPEQLLTQRSLATSQVARFSAGKAVPTPGQLNTTSNSLQSVHAPATPAPGGGQAITVRSNFLDTAYWNAAVTTDTAGNATLVIPMPDNVTTWRVLGQAITTDTLVGLSITQVLATKDLLLRPLLPRFFTLGDTAQVGATINNTTGAPITARLRLLLGDGASALSGSDQTVTLAANAEADVTWPIRITALGNATIQVQAVDIAHPATNDAVQMTLPVSENSTPEDVATSGDAGSNTQEVVQIPSGIEPNEGGITLTLEPTLAAGLRVGADFLATYPYQSSIDLAAQILGEAELGRLPARAAVLTAAEQAALHATIAHDLEQLAPMQHGDGGFGWWIDDPYSSPYITVYVVQALTVARDLGYPVDPTMLANAMSYLVANAQSPAATNAGANYDANLQAAIVYAVTHYGWGQDVTALATQLFDVRTLLSATGEAELAVALHTLKVDPDDARVHTLLADLVGSARLSGTSAHWNEPSYDWQALDSGIATTASVLDALTVLDPHNALVPSTVRWLMAARTANAWESTTATAASLQGLVDYILSSGELNGHYTYSVQRNGAIWAMGQVNATNLTRTRTLTQPIGPQAPAGSAQHITIARTVQPHNGQLHYTINLQYFRPVNQIPALSEGVGVARAYLTPTGTSGTLGSTIRVQLRVTTHQDLFYVVLEDPLPAGTEQVDSSLHTTTQLAQIENTSTIPPGTGDLTWYITHTDLRDNRTVLFLDYLPAGTYQYTYLIHLSTRGTFHTLPTHIEQSYFPEVFGRSNGSFFTVK